MNDDVEFKIRTLPRQDERPAKRRIKLPRLDWTQSRRLQVVSGAVILTTLIAFSVLPETKAPARALSSQQPLRDPMIKRLDRYVEDVRLKEEVLRQRRELENLKLKSPNAPFDLEATAPEAPRPLGVTMDSENTADRLYRELNDRPTLNVDSLPESRINARLEKNKWVNELDRQERVQFVRNFIKSAYDRGYEVELDQNLVVIGVKPIQNRTVSLDQVLDRMSKPGS